MSTSFLITKAQNLINGIRGKKQSSEDRVKMAIILAGILLEESQLIQTSSEKKTQKQLSGMMNDPMGKVFTTAITDQCFRCHSSRRAADQIVFIIHKYGIPDYFSFFKKTSLGAFKIAGRIFSGLLIPLVKYLIRKETSDVIMPGEERALKKHIALRKKENVRINLNHLGEAILGEEEALRRLNTYLNDLSKPEIDYISIKISTIYSQINLLAWDETITSIAAGLRRLYRAAIKNPYRRSDGQTVPKFINLDMEEYRDLHLTIAVFKKVLEEPEFFNFEAGIVLQSYLPDSFLLQQELTVWAMQRVSRGGAPIKIRIVKGANLAMEQFESALRLWPQAPYTSKIEVDANYKRMLIYGCQPVHAQAVHIGVASHNLFDIAFALLLRVENKVEKEVGFEMLEGMADHMRRVVQQISGNMLLYSPAANKEEFQNAVAYLVRRLDENTAPKNFLRQAFDLNTGTPEWEKQAQYFAESCSMIQDVSRFPRRRQNRFLEKETRNQICLFQNEADTDWSLPGNRAWVERFIEDRYAKPIEPVLLDIGGQACPFRPEYCGKGNDPNHPNETLYLYALADQEQINLALNTAKKAQSEWKNVSVGLRAELLHKIADNLKKHRADLIGVMVMDTAKTIPEADVEISEAIDFANYYAHNLQEWAGFPDISLKPKGTILVAPPWNFPCSIPAGGILAALAMGNCVIFKPAPESILVGRELAQIFWDAGVSREVLQFINCEDEPIGCRLIQDPRISAVILTGATSTAKLFLKLRPDLDLMAETGGKNTLVISALSDRDLAIKDLIQSAFGHSGQKCSACSLAILEAEVYDDTHFLNQLRDATSSLHVGSSRDLKTRINPLIRAPGETLMRGLTQLEEGESWLLEPKQHSENPNLWSPGIKLGVRPGNFTFQNELFGPVLGLVRASSFEDALTKMNMTPYGLTAGIHSLDEREQEAWLKRIVAGNCYINRTITGAIVERQPFGGCKESSFGKGFKAGGPNYLTQLVHIDSISLPDHREMPSETVKKLMDAVKTAGLISKDEEEKWIAACESYAFYWKHYFSKAHDPCLVKGQDNLQCYVRHTKVTYIVNNDDRLSDILLEIAAALTCRTPLEIAAIESSQIELLKSLALPPLIHLSQVTFSELVQKIREGQVERVRSLKNPSAELQKILAEAPCPINIGPVQINGRLELLNFLREVSVSRDYQRYGNLGDRENEKRAPLPGEPQLEHKFCHTCDCHD